MNWFFPTEEQQRRLEESTRRQLQIIEAAKEETTVSEPTFTPGPWRAGYADEQDRKERMFVRAERVDGQPYVAVCPHPIVGSHEANACLISAAPDLLAACKLAKERLDHMGMDWLGKGPDPLEAAIAKAEGR